MDCYRFRYRYTVGLLCYGKMARKLRLQNRSQLVDIPFGGIGCVACGTGYRELAKLASSHEKSGGGTSVRVNNNEQ